MYFCFDALKTDSVIYVVTESVTPLQSYLKNNPSNDKAIAWGLHQLVVSIEQHIECHRYTRERDARPLIQTQVTVSLAMGLKFGVCVFANHTYKNKCEYKCVHYLGPPCGILLVFILAHNCGR